ncbi:uncharacterized protein LOC142318747 isoform X2 [Lycorma delicatula]
MRVLDDDEVELYQLDEDAPQVAGIIDERPPEVQAMEYYGNAKRWKVFGTENGDGELTVKDSFETAVTDLKTVNSIKSLDIGVTEQNQKIARLLKGKHKQFLEDSSFGNNHNIYLPQTHRKLSSSLEKTRKVNDLDMSPSHSSYQKSCKNKYKDKSDSDSDLSDPRKSNKSPIRELKNQTDSDLSPPRSSNKYKHHKDSESDLSPPRRLNKIPERKSRQHTSSDSDFSLPGRSERKIRYRDSDLSPPRKTSRYEKKSKHYREFSPQEKRKGSLLSSRKNCNESDSDISPPRVKLHSDKRCDKNKRTSKDCEKYNRLPDVHNKKSSVVDYKKDRRKYDSSDSDGGSRSRTNENKFKQHKSKERDHFDSHRTGSSSHSKHNKMEKTLDGKQAGLQNAKQLRKELEEFKDKEHQMFSKLSTELSGKGAAPIMRDRKTGQKRDTEKEKQQAIEKAQKSAEQNEKYAKWGRGIKQVEEAAERFANAVHEMSKPLARYADDDDLDKHLKAQEREGDPMLDYIRQKQKESVTLLEVKPVYKGSFMPNRFGIRPGYRWDGVDRSNGFEKQWFTTQNNRKARDEEAYKWSISDM